VLTDRVGIPFRGRSAAASAEHRHVLPVHSTLPLCTDGLLEQYAPGTGGRARSTEARTVPGRFGVRDVGSGRTRPTTPLADSADLDLDLESLCDRVMATLVPARRAAGDIALIAIRPTPRTDRARRR